MRLTKWLKPGDTTLVRILGTNASNNRCIRQVNAAEAEFWRRSQSTRVDFSDKILGFECGGQQWVHEVAFPVGTLEKLNGNDLNFMVRFEAWWIFYRV